MNKHELITNLLQQAHNAISLDRVGGLGSLAARNAAYEAANDIIQHLIDQYGMNEEEIGYILQESTF